ncbi:hypothetical protein [Roseinatronobacter bogoriensis]|uniref:hypothetical protein n=1 Tax=Roseinatronobacter bogoriensis TaxID=119542 RepID=UPI001065D3E3|nr:hypothetical protein [Rhodobaca bogoriensis]MBB4207288.1 hypothetical protein [Rhodobaca bogoriensis DSM 18756]TDY65786.1 hypothetical protein EV660_11754 [Rhodobaca bogoriensis DSM 18756]
MVSRNIHPDTKAAIAAGSFCPVVMVYLDWPEGPVRAHSNVGPIQWQGHEWLGLGKFAGLSAPEEAAGLAQSAASLQLIGAPDEVDAYLDSPIRGRPGEIWFGVVTERAGNVLIGEPFRIFAGYMDAMRDTIQAADGGITRVITIDVANGPSQRLSASLFHTDEDQRRTHPNDTAGRLVINSEARFERLSWPE